MESRLANRFKSLGERYSAQAGTAAERAAAEFKKSLGKICLFERCASEESFRSDSLGTLSELGVFKALTIPECVVFDGKTVLHFGEGDRFKGNAAVERGTAERCKLAAKRRSVELCTAVEGLFAQRFKLFGQRNGNERGTVLERAVVAFLFVILLLAVDRSER